MSENYNPEHKLSIIMRLVTTIDRVSYTVRLKANSSIMGTLKETMTYNNELIEACSDTSEENLNEVLRDVMASYLKLYEICVNSVHSLEEGSFEQAVALECLAVLLLGVRGISFVHPDFRNIDPRIKRTNEKILAVVLKEFGKKK